jgi:hypothetical protein
MIRRTYGSAILLLAACGTDTTDVTQGVTTLEPKAPTPSEPAPPSDAAPSGPAATSAPAPSDAIAPSGPASSPVYVLSTAVSTDSGSTTYVALLDDLASQQLDLSRAREFGGWSDLALIGERVFVSSGEAPEVYRFAVSSDGGDLRLVDDGVISFANYVGDANFYSQEVVSPTKAYLAGENELVIWNPSTLEITGTLPYPELPAREGIEPFIALDRGGVVRDDRLYVAVSWSDTENLNMLPDSRIVVIDVVRDEVVEVLDAPCVDLAVADRDEQGNLYFSNWVYSPGATLLYGDDSACTVRIPAGSGALDDWSLRYADVNGREGAALGYAGDGKWLYSSFLGDPASYDPQTDDWFDWLFGDTWQFEVLDPATRTSQVVTGLPKNGGGYYTARFDGATHILVPGNGYDTTAIYALAADGTVKHEIDTLGWSTRLFKLR